MRHSRDCLNANLTAIESTSKTRSVNDKGRTTSHGCTCKPTYYTLHSDPRTGDPVKMSRGRDRKVSNAALSELQVELNRGTYKRVEAMQFSAWADKWMAQHKLAGATTRSYQASIDYANRAFGRFNVNDVSKQDIMRMLDIVRDDNQKIGRTVSDSTLAKHLKTLSSCFNAAIEEGIATTNPTRYRQQRPKAAKTNPGYFTDSELVGLWKSLEAPKFEPVYAHAIKLALMTGLRQGELIALTWGDLNLGTSELYVRHSWSKEDGLKDPKDHEARTVHLVPDAVTTLSSWTRIQGTRPYDELVFPAPRGLYLNGQWLRKKLYQAMESAGIPQIGERGVARTFHSLRHTFARLILESGEAPIDWCSAELGHSSILITVQRYGQWSDKAQRKQAAKMTGVFDVAKLGGDAKAA